MNLTKEKKIIKEWVSKHSEDKGEWDVFYQDKNSYWKQRESTNGIEEYDISNLTDIQNELKKILEKYDSFQEIEKVLSVAILKSCRDEIEEDVYITDWVYKL